MREREELTISQARMDGLSRGSLIDGVPSPINFCVRAVRALDVREGE